MLAGLPVQAARAIGLTLAMVALAAALVSGVSSASTLPGPHSLSTGFDADTLFFDGDQTAVWFPRMQRLRGTWVRIPVAWNAIAPASPPPGFNSRDPGDPSYYWFPLDRAIKEARASHLHVLLMLAFPPKWALGPGAEQAAYPDSWRPDSTAYGMFARAVAARYSGHYPDPALPGVALPRVRDFQAWNEPNLPSFLEPQWTRTNHGPIPASPSMYRGLLNSFYHGVKAVQRDAHVVAAGLAPYGDRPGVNRMRPVTFLRELLCLHGRALRRERCPHPAHLDAIDIHPYSLKPTIHAFNADDVSVPDLGRLSRVVRVASRARRILPRGAKPIWTTEIGWETSPPDPTGVSLAQQAGNLSRAFYELWRQGVSHVLWYEVRDPGGPNGSFASAGLFFRQGRPKPSTVAFRFPFAAIHQADGTTVLWGRAPTAGRVTVQVALGGGWRSLLRLRTTGDGVFYSRHRLGALLHTVGKTRRPLTLRARAGTVTSNVQKTR
jgi:hypothetical protein